MDNSSVQPQKTEAPKAGKANAQQGSLYETVKTVVIAVVIALGIRTFAFEPFNIPSGSMLPTLLVGDYLFVSKYAYGYSKYSFPMGMGPFEGRALFSPPKQGDVAVFKLPSDNSTDYIKRVIGLPGDRIQVINGILHINEQPVPREPVSKQFVTENGFPAEISEYIETLPNGVKHTIWERSDEGPLDNTPVYTVPEGHFFMMGDNRDNSTDSRVLSPRQLAYMPGWDQTAHARYVSSQGGVGFVPAENLVGRAEILFFSLDEGTRFYEIWEWPWALRFSRFFNDIH